MDGEERRVIFSTPAGVRCSCRNVSCPCGGSCDNVADIFVTINLFRVGQRTVKSAFGSCERCFTQSMDMSPEAAQVMEDAYTEYIVGDVMQQSTTS